MDTSSSLPRGLQQRVSSVSRAVMVRGREACTRWYRTTASSRGSGGNISTGNDESLVICRVPYVFGGRFIFIFVFVFCALAPGTHCLTTCKFALFLVFTWSQSAHARWNCFAGALSLSVHAQFLRGCTLTAGSPRTLPCALWPIRAALSCNLTILACLNWSIKTCGSGLIAHRSTLRAQSYRCFL